MAVTRTTLSAAVAAGDLSVVLASITGLAVGQPIKVDKEEMRVLTVPSAATEPVGVLRGVNGSAVAAHVSGASAEFGPPADFSPGSGFIRQREIQSFSADGTVVNPTPGNDAVVVLNGTSVIALTVAVPSKLNDGDKLTIIANGAAAHTVTFTGGISGAGSSYDVVTFNGTKPTALELMAVNSVWVPLCQPAMGGTVTNLIGSIA